MLGERKQLPQTCKLQSRTMDLPPPVGLCLHMCPEKERRERESQERLHQFELRKGQQTGRNRRGKGHHIADPARTVKEYSRPAAGKELSFPEDLRPPAVLLKTVQYLLNEVWDNINDRDSACVAEAYSFVFDRLRAVRQDLIVQRVRGLEGALVLEGSLGFLLCVPYLVRNLPLADYDEVLHTTQVRESFAELMECYKGCGRFPRQAEFQALLLLYDLGNLDAMTRTLQLPRSVRYAPQVCLALAINRAHLENNWVRLFRMVRRCDCLQTCAFYRHLPSSRYKAICTLTYAYSSRNCRYPLDLLTRLIAVDSPSLASDMCKRQGLILISGEQPSILFLKNSFKDLGPECPGREIHLVELKKGDVSWVQVMSGQECMDYMTLHGRK
ncbi:SAC3 domain-containing protein 1 isoform X1 [Pseudophryne corroboree]|uniref:SAC3 domain-containing protein 1 isoform X1 n=1 Tax=Pseudophryne corroboree TaxID=495146 RepID=UPI003081372D